MKISKKQVALLLASFALSLSACSKKDSGSSWYENELTRHLPKGTVGFVLWDAAQPGYDKYLKEQSDGSSDELVAAVGSLNAAGKESLAGQFVEVLKESGISRSDNPEASLISKGAIFLAPGETKTLPTVCAYLSAAAGVDFDQKFSELERRLSSQGHRVEKTQTSAGAGFSISPKDAADPRFSKIYAAFNKNLASLCTTSTAADALFKPAEVDGIAFIKAQDNFKTALARIGSVGNFFTLGYADAKDFAKTLYESVPPESKVGASFRPEDLPIKAILAGRSMNESISDTVILTADEGNESGQKLISGLASVGRLTSLDRTPEGALLSLSFDGTTLHKIRDFALGEVDQARRQTLEKELEILASLKSLSLGVLESSGGSPFPGVMLSATAADPAALTSSIDAKISKAVSSAGLPVGPWQTKEIGGSQVKFIQSPMGIGLYLSQTSDGILLASSEEVLSDTAKAKAGSIKSLSSALPPGVKNKLEDGNKIFAAYINFSQIGGLIESAQGTLAMFTGGSASPELSESIEKLKKMGSVAVSAGFDEDAIRVQSDFMPTPKTAG